MNNQLIEDLHLIESLVTLVILNFRGSQDNVNI